MIAMAEQRYDHHITPPPVLGAEARAMARKLVHPRDPIRPPGAEARW